MIKNVIIPGKALSELNKIVSDSEEDINIFFASNQVLFKVGHINFISRLLEGTIQIQQDYSQRTMKLKSS